MTASPSAPIVAIACARCRSVVHRIVDGPGLNIVQLESREEAIEPGDDCVACPVCGLEQCVRVLRRAS